MLDPNQEVVIHSVGFPGEYAIEIGYFEKRHQLVDKGGQSIAGLMQTIVLDTKAVGMTESYDEVMDALSELIEEGLRTIRTERKDPRARRRIFTDVTEEDYSEDEDQR